jgi:hypothetical protein
LAHCITSVAQGQEVYGAWRGRLARYATQAEYFSPDKNNTFANFHARSMRDFFPLTRFAGSTNLIFIFLNCPCSFPSVERFLGFGVGIEKRTRIFLSIRVPLHPWENFGC